MSPGVTDTQTNTHLALLNMSWKKQEEPKLEELSEKEMEAVTMVFRSFETGLREATIYSKDLLPAMKMLGLNPMEQEIIDLTNEIARNGLIYFPEFCRIVHRRFRDGDEEEFRQNMFKVDMKTFYSLIIHILSYYVALILIIHILTVIM